MKKEARSQAERIFLDSRGKMSDVQLAKQVGVSLSSVARWRRRYDWISKIGKTGEKAPAPPRKKDAHDQAVAMYMKAAGKITNKAVADKVGVTTTTISNWKAREKWSDKLMEQSELRVPLLEETDEPTSIPPAVAPVEEAEEMEIDLDALACPDHITLLNKRIDEMLRREHLSAMDIKTVAEAKEAILRAVTAYIDVVERISED